MTERFLLSVDPQRIRFNPLNPRKHQGHELDRLRVSIQRFGILQPPIVRALPGNLFEAIDGEGRIFVSIELKLPEIQVISVGSIRSEEALLLLQVSNTIRNFNFLAECRGLANLHRREMTMAALAKEFGYSLSKTQDLVNIGYLPEDLMVTIQKHIAASEDRARIWTQALLLCILLLREVLPGQTSMHTNGSSWSPIDGIYDYTEVRTALERVLTGQTVTHEEMKIYVTNRRYEIYKDRFNAVLDQKLQEELALAKAELEAVKEREYLEFEAAKNQEVLATEATLRDRYERQIITLEAQIESLNKSYTRAVNDVSKKPESIQQQEQKIQEEVEQASRERQRLEALRRQSEEEAKHARLKREIEARQDRERWEAEKKEQLQADILAQRSKQEQRLQQTEQQLKEYYKRKEQESQIKAENTIHGLLSNAIKSLAETQQIIDHIVSSAMLQPVRELGGAHHESLLWSIRSMSEALDHAERKLVDGHVSTYVEGGIVNGYQQQTSEHFPK